MSDTKEPTVKKVTGSILLTPYEKAKWRAAVTLMGIAADDGNWDRVNEHSDELKDLIAIAKTRQEEME